MIKSVNIALSSTEYSFTAVSFPDIFKHLFVVHRWGAIISISESISTGPVAVHVLQYSLDLTYQRRVLFNDFKTSLL